MKFQKNFPFLVLVVYLLKSFIIPAVSLDFAVIGIFASLYLAQRYFEYAQDLDDNEKVQTKIKELEAKYQLEVANFARSVAAHKEALTKENEYASKELIQKITNLEGRMTNMDFQAVQKRAKENFKNEVRWS